MQKNKTVRELAYEHQQYELQKYYGTTTTSTEIY